MKTFVMFSLYFVPYALVLTQVVTGGLGFLLTAMAMGIRSFGGACASGGAFAADLPKTLRPLFGSIGASGALSAKVSILIGMLSTSFMCHFNAPKFYTELKDNTVPRFMTVVGATNVIPQSLAALHAILTEAVAAGG